MFLIGSLRNYYGYDNEYATKVKQKEQINGLHVHYNFWYISLPYRKATTSNDQTQSSMENGEFLIREFKKLLRLRQLERPLKE